MMKTQELRTDDENAVMFNVNGKKLVLMIPDHELVVVPATFRSLIKAAVLAELSGASNVETDPSVRILLEDLQRTNRRVLETLFPPKKIHLVNIVTHKPDDLMADYPLIHMANSSGGKAITYFQLPESYPASAANFLDVDERHVLSATRIHFDILTHGVANREQGELTQDTIAALLLPHIPEEKLKNEFDLICKNFLLSAEARSKPETTFYFTGDGLGQFHVAHKYVDGQDMARAFYIRFGVTLDEIDSAGSTPAFWGTTELGAFTTAFAKA